MMKRIHQRVVQVFSRQSALETMSICALFLGLLGWLDYITGDYSLIVFYLIPVSLCAWFVGKWSGLFLCGVATFVRFMSDGDGFAEFGAQTLVHYWNELVEFLFLLIMSLLFSALKSNLDNEKELARRDPLTDSLNRRSFFDLAEHEINRAQRYGLPLTVAYIDLDNFKTVNDSFGHKTGDELLMLVVTTIRASIRSTDILARFGGDEFVVLLPETPGEAADTFLNKIHLHLDQTMQQRSWPVTFSIGAVTYVHAPAAADSIIHFADELMYQVKRSGKNKVLHRIIGESDHG